MWCTAVPGFRWPIDDLAAPAREAGFAEVGRMSRLAQGALGFCFLRADGLDAVR
jgi:hypothetical protein